MAVLQPVQLMAGLAPGRQREGTQVFQGTAPKLDGFGIGHVQQYTKFCIFGKVDLPSVGPSGDPGGPLAGLVTAASGGSPEYD